MIDISTEQLDLYMSLFRGRTDIYARRWEKENKNGYSPAYSFDWNEFLRFKAQGGTMASFANKELLPLTQEVIHKHILGKEVIGIYPLLENNTSYFIVADFDGDSWIQDSKQYIAQCNQIGLKAYLEKSRSGNGAHVWIFFEQEYPAIKSRAIALTILRKVFNISDFEREVSFDRLLPNQDFHTNKGFGNLIALPLQGQSIEEGNSLFIDWKTSNPYSDQWEFLANIQKMNTSELDNIYKEIDTTNSTLKNQGEAPKTVTKGLAITIDNQIFLQKSELNPQIVKFLREELNFFNTEYLIKQKIGKSVYGVEKYFKLISEENDKVLIPRGFVKNLTGFCDESPISYQLLDQRKKLPITKYKSKIDLFDYQQDAVRESEKHDYGVIVAPPGSGKTIIGLELIVRKAQPTLILVHRKQLLDQWIERIQSFLKINKKEIGQISGSKKKVGKQITVAMVQSLVRQNDLSELKYKFGTIIVDECHHIPAKSFRDVIVGLNSYYLYGLTATPKRKYNDEKLIFYYIGEIICELGKEYKKSKNITDPVLNINETTLKFTYDNGTDDYQLLSKVLVFDTTRNTQITNDILEQVKNKRKILVLTDRKDHVDVLNQYLKKECETITLTGDDSNASKKSKLEQITQGHFQVLLATGQLFGEGIDISTLDCLFLVYPLSFEGKLEQYIGRIQRSSGKQYVFDYRDVNIPYFERMFKKRSKFYKKAFSGELF